MVFMLNLGFEKLRPFGGKNLKTKTKTTTTKNKNKNKKKKKKKEKEENTHFFTKRRADWHTFIYYYFIQLSIRMYHVWHGEIIMEINIVYSPLFSFNSAE